MAIRKAVVIVFCASIALVKTAGPVFAQAALFDPFALVDGCKLHDCSSITSKIVTEIKNSDLPENTVNSQIGLIAALLLEHGQTTPTNKRPDVVFALQHLSLSSSDDVQRAAISQAAIKVNSGEIGLTTPSNAYAVSPERPRWRRFGRWRGWGWRRYFGLF